jgi:hypothetical protein
MYQGVPASNQGRNTDYYVSGFHSVYQNPRMVEWLIDNEIKILWKKEFVTQF